MGARCSATFFSSFVMGIATPFPPTAKFPRISLPCGIRAKVNGTTSPPTRRTRLSPCAISGRKRCAINVRAPFSPRVSTMLARFRPFGPTRNTPIPPIPSKGLITISWCCWWNTSIALSSRVTKVGGISSGNSVIDNFSEWSRIAVGLLNTFAPWRVAADNNQVVLRYSISNGGSVRIKTAANVFSGRLSVASNSNHVVLLGLIRSDWQSATTKSSLQSTLRLWQNQIWWPDTCATRIIAKVESLLVLKDSKGSAMKRRSIFMP